MKTTERDLGVAAALAAGRLCEAVRAEMLRGEGLAKLDKQDRSPVTIADFGSQAGRYWVLDPIDGTRGFLRDDQYAVALALIEDGQVQWGFLCCPALPFGRRRGALFVARRGGGTEALALDGTPIGPVRVSDL